MSHRMRIAADISDLVGRTPMIYLDRMREDRPGSLAAKMECMNPSGSIKDRTVLYMLRDAETRGILKAGDTIIESTSGNTGISLAAFSARRGYRLILTMPESTGGARAAILRAYGAELIQTPAEEGMRGALVRAQQLHEEIPGSYMPQQFVNPANPLSHLKTTAREIWHDTQGTVKAVVAGIGTGGTISGIGKALKKMSPDVRIVGVEPERQAVLTTKDPAQKPHAGACGIDGIGAGFVPQTLDLSVVDEVLAVDDDDARETARLMARREGLLAGTSSGAAVFAALNVASREEMRDKLIVVICPDNGLKYIGTELFT